MGRPAKPVAQKRLEGTYRADRDGERERAEERLAACALAEGACPPCPDTIKSGYCRAYWGELSRSLASLGVLSAVDLPQLEELCFTLERLREAAAALADEPPRGENYARLLSAYLKLARRFDELGAKYYVSPQARSRLALDALNAAKTAREVDGAGDAIGSLLSGRRA